MKKILRNNLLEGYEDGSDLGGGGSGHDTGVDVFNDAPADGGIPQGGAPAAQPAAAPVDDTPRLTPEQWQSVQQTVQPPPQAQAQPEMTPEQRDEMLKVYKVNEQVAQSILGEHAGAEQAAALQQFVDGIVTHVTTTMGYANQALMENVNSQYSPALQMVEAQKEQDFTSGLMNVYPALKGQEQVIGQVIQQLKASGFQARDEHEAARAVAGQVEMLMKTVNPNFTLATQQAPAAAPQQTGSAMPPMASMAGGSGGGAAGAANPGASGQSKKQGWNVFD